MDEEKIELKAIEQEERNDNTDVIYINVESRQLLNSEEESTDLDSVSGGIVNSC